MSLSMVGMHDVLKLVEPPSPWGIAVSSRTGSVSGGGEGGCGGGFSEFGERAGHFLMLPLSRIVRG